MKQPVAQIARFETYVVAAAEIADVLVAAEGGYRGPAAVIQDIDLHAAPCRNYQVFRSFDRVGDQCGIFIVGGDENVDSYRRDGFVASVLRGCCQIIQRGLLALTRWGGTCGVALLPDVIEKQRRSHCKQRFRHHHND